MRARARWAVVLPLALMALVALFVGAGQAQSSSEVASEEEAAPASALQAKQAARKEQIAVRKAEREAERRLAREQREANRAAARAEHEDAKRVQNESRPRTNGDVHFSCTGVTWNFTEFPAGSNTVVQVVRIYAGESGTVPTSTITGSFTFPGPTGETRTAFEAPPGFYKIDAWARWKGNGLKGSFDILGKLSCSSAPALTVEKLQKIAGTTGPYTSSPVTGQVGETVDYEIVVKNTGNVPLKIGNSDFIDHKCTGISGGPSKEELEVGASATYRCEHVLTETGSYTNEAEVSGIPPTGLPVTSTSNTVVAEVPPPSPTPEPRMSVEKLQEIVGDSGSYTTAPLTGQIGQIVQYEIIVENTGNVPLTLSAFSDPRCDEGTITGGPEGAALPVGGSTTYTCTHILDAEDATAGSYTNVVSVTGTPPGGGVAPITQESNPVVVEVPRTQTPGATPTTPGSGTTGGGSSGVLSSTFSEPSKSGVLAFSSSVPKLKGPQGCVRQDFYVSIKAKGVAKVTFYLDKHKLRALTAKNAVKGLLRLKLDPSKLAVGPHKLLAKITMAATSTTKATVASRSVTVLRCRTAVLTPKFTG
jgi:uncharacterized repeat protein (TIGR01451 family)